MFKFLLVSLLFLNNPSVYELHEDTNISKYTKGEEILTVPEQPSDPEPENPGQPTDPEPSDPEPSDPEPSDPEPENPGQPTDPDPENPEQPTDPEPSNPDPENPGQPTDPEPNEPQTPTVTYKEVNETVYAVEDVNVRKGPGTGYEKLGLLNKGDSVRRIGIGSDGWSKVIYNGREAYINSEYLTTQKPSIPEPETPQEPENPVEPETPVEPENPVEPEVPEEPVEPENPEELEQPNESMPEDDLNEKPQKNNNIVGTIFVVILDIVILSLIFSSVVKKIIKKLKKLNKM